MQRGGQEGGKGVDRMYERVCQSRIEGRESVEASKDGEGMKRGSER